MLYGLIGVDFSVRGVYLSPLRSLSRAFENKLTLILTSELAGGFRAASLGQWGAFARSMLLLLALKLTRCSFSSQTGHLLTCHIQHQGSTRVDDYVTTCRIRKMRGHLVSLKDRHGDQVADPFNGCGFCQVIH